MVERGAEYDQRELGFQMKSRRKVYRVGDSQAVNEQWILSLHDPDMAGLEVLTRDIQNLELLSVGGDRLGFVRYEFPYRSDMENYIVSFSAVGSGANLQWYACDYHGVEYRIEDDFRRAVPTGRRNK